MNEERITELKTGGTYYEKECPQQNITIIINNTHTREHIKFFNFQGINPNNIEEFEKLNNFLNKILSENKQLKEEKNINRGMILFSKE